MDFGVKLPNDQQCSRIDTIELKHHIVRRLGQQKAEKYFNLLNRYLCFQLSKSAFDKFCTRLLGRENISLHNGFIQAIIRNACINKTSLLKCGKGQTSLNVIMPNGYQSSVQSLCKDAFSLSSRRGMTPTIRECRSKDRLSPLGPHGKLQNVAGDDSVLKFPEQQSATEILSLGSKPPVEVTSVEEGEEVEQDAGSPGIHSQSSLTAPLGICLLAKAASKGLRVGELLSTDTCYNNAELPDTSSLKKRLEQKLGTKRLNVSTDCVNLLNNGLDVFIKRLLKSCLDLAMLRHKCRLSNKVHQQVSMIYGMQLMTSAQVPCISITDFRVAVESNPRILGDDWPVQLEKVSVHASEDYIDR